MLISYVIGGSILGIILGFLSSAGIECLREKFSTKDEGEHTNTGGGEWGLIIVAVILCLSYPFFVFDMEYSFIGILEL